MLRVGVFQSAELMAGAVFIVAWGPRKGTTGPGFCVAPLASMGPRPWSGRTVFASPRRPSAGGVVSYSDLRMQDTEAGTVDEDWEVRLSFLPQDWRELVQDTGALKRLRKDKAVDNLLRTLLLHLQAGGNRGTGHRRIVGAVPDPRQRPCS